ncbi:hypothetical protein PTQ19_14980 [Microbacterium esteraromaticum]|uniref:hypothetical protein n=1 Tax=Microbacterium TaxID=33882 RepID=UPI0019D32784|nr:hypothetical protein [Microbacterium esteraromaticum]MBN7794079.1 hypothetical protein [Microbacterium esteraromaticum]MBN8424941.1 hypothetical protein [Microbacterium esteraromaticum]MCA1306852.1 hypothetical protein [Microbacterium esteraromaticum]WDH78791.1 hypothetical protein PTQ19_14980 [Microbacterium esteraromaticum]
MNKNTVWTILGVIGAVVIAWWLVNILFAVLGLIVKLALVAVVAVVVYFALRAFFRSGAD